MYFENTYNILIFVYSIYLMEGYRTSFHALRSKLQYLIVIISTLLLSNELYHSIRYIGDINGLKELKII